MRLNIPALSDFHVHFRQDPMMDDVTPFTARHCAYALAMPNTDPPLTDVASVMAYRFELSKRLFYTIPLMTFKLTMKTTSELVRDMKHAGVVAGKLYPEGVTTNSQEGITATCLRNPSANPGFMDVIGAMEKHDIVLCLHGEMPGEFCLDREKAFLPFVRQLHGHFPKLRVVLEHITTEAAVQFVLRYSPEFHLAATITAHHLCLTLDDIVGDTLHPHNFCKPVAKLPEDRATLRWAARSGHRCFFLGSDSAPHLQQKKECDHGCAGVYTAPILPEVLVEEFENMDAVKSLPGFVSYFGNEFYRLPSTERNIRLTKHRWTVPSEIKGIVPFKAGETLTWRLE